jgi:molybdate transport system substrate-binding protein
MRHLRNASFFAVLLFSSPAWAQTLTVAAASDLQAVFPAVAQQFQSETGHAVMPVFGSSGNFFTQIQNGAPFDIFFSADIDYPRQLEAAHLAEAGSLYEYAAGRIVLWARKDSELDLSRGLAVLDEARVKKIAIANPAHAPYGRAAVAALQHERMYDRVKSKLVLGENISQAAQFVQSGNAEIGIIALSLTLSPEAKAVGISREIPSGSYPPIDQGAIILSSSRQKDLARRFVAFLQTPAIVRLLESYGFSAQRADSPSLTAPR